jgi:hemerythrin
MIWKEKYEIGVPEIDAQHMELFSRVGSFLNTLRSDTKWEEKVNKVNETVAFMKDYVITHFRDEEAYQEEIGYPERDRHKKIHDGMVEYVAEVSKQYEEFGFKEIHMQQFAGKLVTWLVNHVVAEDQKIADYAKSREGRS